MVVLWQTVEKAHKYHRVSFQEFAKYLLRESVHSIINGIYIVFHLAKKSHIFKQATMSWAESNVLLFY